MTDLHAPHAKRLLDLFFFGVLLTYCFWIFSFPVFPTQDGPVHLYYATVIKNLIGQSNLFNNYFFLKIPPPPYILHYAILLLLVELLPAVTAEKIVIALSVCLFCLGARFLLKNISIDYRVLSLLALPLSLNGMVGLGFYNYCLSVGLSFFAIGCWLRGTFSSSAAFRVIFLGLVLLMLFTHPVPLMVTLVTAAAIVVTKWWQEWRAYPDRSFGSAVKTVKLDLFFLFLAGCALLYIGLFVSAERTTKSFDHSWIQTAMLQDFIRARPLMLVYGRLRSSLYRWWLFFLLAGVTVAGVSAAIRNLRRKEFTTANLFALAGLAALLLYPFVPRTINGSDYFADRLVVYLWIFAIAGCSGSLWTRMRWTPVAAAMVAALGVIVISDSTLRKIAGDLETLERASVRDAGSRGIAVEAPLDPPAQTTFAPFFWSAATYFRVTNTVMLNSPWLDLKISPLSAKRGLLAHSLPPDLINFPYRLLGEMDQVPEFRKKMSNQVDFMVLSGSVANVGPDRNNTQRRRWLNEWSCQKGDEYWVCRPPR